MQKLLVALFVTGVVLAGTATPAGAGPPKCQAGYTRKWACTKEVPTPRPKHFPKNEPWLGEKCVKHGWVCEPPIK
jgi:hypothetical protein